MAEFRNAMEVAQRLAEFWPIKWIMVIILFWAAKRVIGLEITEIVTLLVKEFKDLFSGQATVGRLNAATIVSTLIIGVIILIGVSFSEVLELASRVVSSEISSEFQDAARPIWLVIAIGAIGLLSVWIIKKGE